VGTTKEAPSKKEAPQASAKKEAMQARATSEQHREGKLEKAEMDGQGDSRKYA
jgi:hypothetical protein